MTSKSQKSPPSIGGIILAGGRNKRMGRDKSTLVDSANRTFIERIVATLTKTASPILIVRNKTSKHLMPDHMQVVFDEQENCGPLEGLRTSLARLQNQCEAAFVTCCDSPLLKVELVEVLRERWERVKETYDGIVPVDGERVYGLTAIYRTSLHSLIAQQLESGNYRVRDFSLNSRFLKLDIDQLKPADPNLESFFNINTPEEYQEFLMRQKHEDNY